MALDYFYHGQFRAYIVQVQRALSGFQTQFGTNADGTPKLRVVPITWAPQDRLVASILKNNSENTILSTPSMSFYITNVEIPADRRQIPNHVDTRNVVEREIDPISNKYTALRGKSYTVERFMPVAYDLYFQVDVWTSNMQQKCEILEQLLVLFNPGLDIQTNTNALDWTALTTMSLESVTWTTRSIPIGTAFDMDISTLTLKVPAWINPPAKLQRERIVEQIITNISALNESEIAENLDFDRAAIDWARGDVFARDIVTPGNHHVLWDGATIQLLGENSRSVDEHGNAWDWNLLFEKYGKYRAGESVLRFKTNDNMDDHDSDIVGTIQVDNEDPNILHFNIDIASLPMNTIPPINGIIDPDRVWPGNPDNPLPDPQIGDRYMILNPIRKNREGHPWGEFFTAHANDIIEFNADGEWEIAFDSYVTVDKHTVLNLRSGKQLSWTNQEWTNTLAGEFGPGFWRIAL